MKIVSNGEPTGTRIYDDHGKDISDLVGGVTFWHRGGEVPRAEISLYAVEMEIQGKPTVVLKGQVSGKVHWSKIRAIETEDGERIEF